MTSAPNDFNAQKLADRKNRNAGYIYCPYCSAHLTEQVLEGTDRLACSSSTCDFVFYHNPVPAAGAIIVRDNRIILVKRAHPPAIGEWCLPAGFMEWNEHPEQTTVREVKEETGLVITISRLFEVYVGNDDPRTNAVLVLYLAEIVGGELRAGDDAMDVAWFDLNSLPEKIAFAAHRQALADYKQRIGR